MCPRKDCICWWPFLLWCLCLQPVHHLPNKVLCSGRWLCISFVYRRKQRVLFPAPWASLWWFAVYQSTQFPSERRKSWCVRNLLLNFNKDQFSKNTTFWTQHPALHQAKSPTKFETAALQCLADMEDSASVEKSFECPMCLLSLKCLHVRFLLNFSMPINTKRARLRGRQFCNCALDSALRKATIIATSYSKRSNPEDIMVQTYTPRAPRVSWWSDVRLPTATGGLILFLPATSVFTLWLLGVRDPPFGPATVIASTHFQNLS